VRLVEGDANDDEQDVVENEHRRKHGEVVEHLTRWINRDLFPEPKVKEKTF